MRKKRRGRRKIYGDNQNYHPCFIRGSHLITARNYLPSTTPIAFKVESYCLHAKYTRVSVKVERGSTFTCKRDLPNIACTLFTRVKFTCIHW